MASDTLIAFDDFKNDLFNGVHDFDADSLFLALYLSTSNAGTRGTTALKASLTNEHAAANGYTTGGQALVSAAVSEPVAGTTMLDHANFAPYDTAAGGSIIARFGAYWNDTPASPLDPALGSILLDNAPADITVTDTNDLNWTVPANGVMRLSGAET